jgi:NAD(P)-dependent dehydrogenase (short-subunit alcohol dehydrogenase family)
VTDSPHHPSAEAVAEYLRTSRGVVLLTGASSGMGLASALALTRLGFHVVATVHAAHEADIPLSQAAPGSLTTTVLDLSKPEQVAETARFVGDLLHGAGIPGLAGLVNNAGVGVTGPTETVSLDRIRWQFEVNVFGQLALTSAVLPLLRAGHGRIVNIGSVGAWITMPFGGPLCASKAAFRAFNDALRLELKSSGVGVIMLEPGRVKTAAADRVLDDLEPTLAAMSPQHQERYGAAYRTMVHNTVRHEHNGDSPDVVARAVVKALTKARPHTRQPIGGLSHVLGLLGRLLPAFLLDRVRYKALGLGDFARGGEGR